MSLATFASQALTDFQGTAAVAPSSRFLAQAMVEPLPMAEARLIVEFGPGTGVMTRRLLAAARSDAKLLAFEINPRFVDYLREEITDPRLEIIAAGAESAGAELRRRGCEQVDAVLSSLGFGLLPEAVGHDILQGLAPLLHSGSGFTQFQYLQRMRWRRGKMEFFDVGGLLSQYFGTVQQSRVWRNFPPACVYHCQV